MQIGAAVFSICFAFLLAYWDLTYRFRMILSIKSARAKAETHAAEMAGRVFALSRTYRNHRIYFSPDLVDELPPVFLLISNHQSIVDIPVLVHCLRSRLRFVAKSSLFTGVPLISVLLRLQRHASVDRRGRGHRTMAELDRLARRAADGICPVVFPEGTRSKTGALGAFHVGAVKRILEVFPLRVATIAVDGGWVVSKAGQLAAGLKDCVYRVKLLDISRAPCEREGADEALRRSRRLIDEQIRAWHGSA